MAVDFDDRNNADVDSPRMEKKQPTQAAALRYRYGEDVAPIVVASGQGEIAQKIIELANKSGVPNHPEPALVQILSRLEPGSVIPEETYQTVASILAFIWHLDGKYDKNKNLG